jgi:hypothetical protein
VEDNERRAKGLRMLKFQDGFDDRLAQIDEADGFDSNFEVETNDPVEPWEKDEADDFALVNNARYSPTPVRTIRQALEAILVQYEDFTFIDMGAGKGRVMLVASEFPFRRIIGVEFSRKLCDIAVQNIQRYTSSTQRCKSLEVCCTDAAEFIIPEEPSVYYFYEPFTPLVAGRVFQNIEQSIYRRPRKILICLVGKQLNPFIEDRHLWTPTGGDLGSPDDPWYDARIYTNNTYFGA